MDRAPKEVIAPLLHGNLFHVLLVLTQKKKGYTLLISVHLVQLVHTVPMQE